MFFFDYQYNVSGALYDDRSSGGGGGGGDVRDGAIRALMKTRIRTEVTLKELDFMIAEYVVCVVCFFPFVFAVYHQICINFSILHRSISPCLWCSSFFSFSSFSFTSSTSFLLSQIGNNTR